MLDTAFTAARLTRDAALFGIEEPLAPRPIWSAGACVSRAWISADRQRAEALGE
jgi:hypothetical protein